MGKLTLKTEQFVLECSDAAEFFEESAHVDTGPQGLTEWAFVTRVCAELDPDTTTTLKLLNGARAGHGCGAVYQLGEISHLNKMRFPYTTRKGIERVQWMFQCKCGSHITLEGLKLV